MKLTFVGIVFLLSILANAAEPTGQTRNYTAFSCDDENGQVHLDLIVDFGNPKVRKYELNDVKLSGTSVDATSQYGASIHGYLPYDPPQEFGVGDLCHKVAKSYSISLDKRNLKLTVDGKNSRATLFDSERYQGRRCPLMRPRPEMTPIKCKKTE